MIHARRAVDGSLYEGSCRPSTYPDDVPIARLWGPGEVVMACGEECEKKHAEGEARCVVPHAALIAAREQAAADEQKIAAKMREIAIRELQADGEIAAETK